MLLRRIQIRDRKHRRRPRGARRDPPGTGTGTAGSGDGRLQDRHLRGAELSFAEIEGLPLYRRTFAAGVLPSGRRRIVCPRWDPGGDRLQIPLKHLPRRRPTTVDEKYDRRAPLCVGNGIWHKVTLAEHMQIIAVIAELLGVRRGDY
eukprot:gene3482-2508_t